MLKREDPFTPQTKRGKRTKDHASPAVKTPLRNVLSAENVLDTPNTLENNNNTTTDEKQQQRRKRALLVKKKSSAELLSPAPGISPRAAPVASVGSPAAMLRPSPSLSSLSTGHPSMSIEQMTRSFDEWMRIAAENKINAKNTWNFALIDYFSELTFLKDADSDAINFQKASCTLDGCVKIYSSRVDAVVDETGKLLNGLNDRDNDVIGNDDDGEGDDEDDGDDDHNRHGYNNNRRQQRTKKPTATLEKNPDSLSLRGKLEMDGATIDPLFKKTCAEFDEAAGGTLLFNLTVDHHVKVVFDSNTADYIDGDTMMDNHQDNTINADMLLQSFGADLFNMAGKQLTTTIANYSFLNYTDNLGIHDRLAASLEKLTVVVGADDNDDHIDDTDNPFGDVVSVPLVGNRNNNNNNFDYLDDDHAVDHHDPVLDYNDPVLDQYSFVEDGFAMTTGKPVDQFDFLDVNGDKMKTTWAGTDHWKIKRVTALTRNSHSAGGSTSSNTTNTNTATASRRSHEIDFSSTDVDLSQLLIKSSTTTANTSVDTTQTTLPDDLQITSDLFTVLFLRPTWRFSRVKVLQRHKNVPGDARNDFEPVEFIADVLHNDDDDDDSNTMIHDDNNNNNIHDGDDYNIQDDDDVIDMSQQMLTISQQPTTTNALSVSFARRPKRVDVHHLKESIWRTLHHESNQNIDTTLGAIVDELPSQYGGAADKADLSVQFAFICLLHLANEHGLVLAERPDGDVRVCNTI